VKPPEFRRRWKRTLLLAPLLAGLFFVAVAGSGDPATGKATKAAAILAALKDPLSLFAERSPGGRGAGALLSTKPGKQAALMDPGPEERVLSQVRDRDPDFGGLPALPGLDDPAFAPDPGVDGLPGGGGFPGGGGGGGGPGGGGFPGGGGGPFAGPFSPQFIPGGGGPPGGGPPGSDPPGSGPPGTDPPGGGGIPPVTSAVPEPATWAVMILGFFAVGAAARRRGRTDPARVR